MNQKETIPIDEDLAALIKKNVEKAENLDYEYRRIALQAVADHVKKVYEERDYHVHSLFYQDQRNSAFDGQRWFISVTKKSEDELYVDKLKFLFAL